MLNLKAIVSAIAIVGSMFAVFIYDSINMDSLDCKTAVIFSVKDISPSSLDSLRFNISRLIINGNLISSSVQKNSLLVDMDDKFLTIISQIRVSKKAGDLIPAALKDQLEGNLINISHIYKFPILNQAIVCVKPPAWYYFLSPVAMLLLVAALLLKKRIVGA